LPKLGILGTEHDVVAGGDSVSGVNPNFERRVFGPAAETREAREARQRDYRAA
jgi:hypothetical protein